MAKYATASGDVVLLDDDVAARLPGKVSIGSHGYAQVFVGGRMELLHRWLLGLRSGDGLIGDHINRRPLDCRRINLRVVTPAQSNLNRALPSRDLPHGVCLTRGGRYEARVQRGRQKFYLGVFDTPGDAALAVAEFVEPSPFLPVAQGPHMTETTEPSVAEMREWLRANSATTGIEVGERGFLSQKARDAYKAAHSA